MSIAGCGSKKVDCTLLAGSPLYLIRALWWDNAKQCDQAAVLVELWHNRCLAGIPWAFLPQEVQPLLAQRVRIKAEQLDPNWQRAK
jgi:hypothetical protein